MDSRNDNAPTDTTVTDGRRVEMEIDEAVDKRNFYAMKKTVAQGMMDIALLTANANQLRFVLEFTPQQNKREAIFMIVVTLIVLSIFLQIVVGVLLIFKGRLDYKGKEKERHSNMMNNVIVFCVFFVTVINVFIAAFNINSNPQPVPAAAPP